MNQLSKGITKIAWGYFFITFNLYLNGFNLIPDFVGYLLFLSAIQDLKDEQRELLLLKTFAQVLLIWSVVTLIFPDLTLIFIRMIIHIILLYFNFQLLTNIASIAQNHQIENHAILQYRTILTVLNTAIMIDTSIANWLNSRQMNVVEGIFLVVYIIMTVLLIIRLFELKNSLTNNQLNVETKR